ncbi:rhodanese-like domain-containing protein [Roseovarius sp.]
MSGSVRRLALAAALLVLVPPAAQAQEDALRDAILDYMDFATYHQGILQPQQIDRALFEQAIFVDARDASEYAQGHIPGAVNIDWRAVPREVESLPDGMIVVYCNTGTLSAQAALAARLMGYDNVVMLQGGLDGWRRDGAWHPQ